LQQIGMLYRTRWLIEILNKLHKSFNGLSTVNSSKPYIILTFIIHKSLSSIFDFPRIFLSENVLN